MTEDNEAAKDTIVKTVQKNDRTQIRVLVSTYHDKDYIHIREFWRQSDDEEYKHGKGLSFPYDATNVIDALIDGLTIIKKAVEQGESLEQEPS